MILSDKSQGVDFSSCRLPDNYGEWILDTIHFMGLKEYTEYEGKVFSALDGLREGRCFDVTLVLEDMREIFIRICCLYIHDHPQVVFNDTYTRIYKQEKYEPGKLDQRRKKICPR